MSKIEIFKVSSSPKKKNTRLSNLENQEEESQEFLVFSNNLF